MQRVFPLLPMGGEGALNDGPRSNAPIKTGPGRSPGPRSSYGWSYRGLLLSLKLSLAHFHALSKLLELLLGEDFFRLLEHLVFFFFGVVLDELLEDLGAA